MAARYDLVFHTRRFNLTQPRAHYINPTCFGDDAAAWLRERLNERGIAASEPAQEDWGWYIEAAHDGSPYFIGVGGNTDDETAGSDAGEWRFIVEKRRSWREKLAGKNAMTPDDALLNLLRGMVEREPDMRVIGVE